jgi:hypothetical protein
MWVEGWIEGRRKAESKEGERLNRRKGKGWIQGRRKTG